MQFRYERGAGGQGARRAQVATMRWLAARLEDGVDIERVVVARVDEGLVALEVRMNGTSIIQQVTEDRLDRDLQLTDAVLDQMLRTLQPRTRE